MVNNRKFTAPQRWFQQAANTRECPPPTPADVQPSTGLLPPRPAVCGQSCPCSRKSDLEGLSEHPQTDVQKHHRSGVFTILNLCYWPGQRMVDEKKRWKIQMHLFLKYLTWKKQGTLLWRGIYFFSFLSSCLFSCDITSSPSQPHSSSPPHVRFSVI